MENLIEKIKGLDKKVWIGAGIAAAVIIILVIVLVIGSGNKPAGSQGGSQSGTQAGTETEKGSEVFGSEDLGTETLGTEITTETEMGTEVETESESESQTQGIGGTTVTTRPDVDGVEQKPVTTTPDGQEILGEGSASMPLEVIPDLDTMSVTTIQIPAGKTVYYNIQRVGGMYLTINDPDAYVITSSGKRYDASNGKVSFQVENAMANEYVSFQIGNKSGAAKAFTIKFANLNGTYQNPQEITTLGATKSLSKGDQDGWYYRYTATQTGTIRFYITYTKESDITVTNLSTSAVRNFAADSTGAEYIELNVTAGDVIMIQICACPDKRWNYPATDITWRGEYAQ